MKLQNALTMTGPSPFAFGAAPIELIQSTRKVSKYLKYATLLTCCLASMSPHRMGIVIS